MYDIESDVKPINKPFLENITKKYCKLTYFLKKLVA